MRLFDKPRLLYLATPITLQLGCSMAVSGGEATYLWNSSIRGHHIYKAVWTPTVGEILVVDQEPSNPHDPHAVAVLKNTDIVGHVPRDISRIFSFFLLHGGVITCEEIGHKKFGKGLEVPCTYKLTGKEAMIVKAREILELKKTQEQVITLLLQCVHLVVFSDQNSNDSCS